MMGELISRATHFIRVIISVWRLKIACVSVDWNVKNNLLLVLWFLIRGTINYLLNFDRYKYQEIRTLRFYIL